MQLKFHQQHSFDIRAMPLQQMGGHPLCVAVPFVVLLEHNYSLWTLFQAVLPISPDTLQQPFIQPYLQFSLGFIASGTK